MSFLTLNGIEIPVLAASVGEVVIGDKVRAFDGTMRSTVRAWKRQWKVSTGPLTVSDAQAFKNLIRGQGDVWSFDTDAYSAKGQAITGTAPTITVGGKFGSYGSFAAASQTFPFPSGSSAVWWQKAQDDSAWRQYALISSGAYYLSGALLGDTHGFAAGVEIPVLSQSGTTLVVSNPVHRGPGNTLSAVFSSWLSSHAYATGNFVTPVTPNGFGYMCTTGGTSGSSAPTWPTTFGATVTDGAAVWKNVGPTAARIDDLVIFPFAVSTSWLTTMAAATVGWGASPRLTAAGTFIGSGSVTVTGEVQDSGINQLVYDSGFGVGQTFDFLLEEV